MRFEKSVNELKRILLTLGFDNGLESELRSKICFQPETFSLRYPVFKENDRMEFVLEFELADESYTCKFYEAILRKKIHFSSAIIPGIDVSELEKKMYTVNWHAVPVSPAETIDTIISNLKLLDMNEEARVVASLLKLQYWSGTPVENLIPNLSSLKAKYEVNQRFYFFDGEAPITIDEAYRFLCNRWREKQLALKKKKEVQEGDTAAESAGVGSASSGDAVPRKMSLLPKKQRGKGK